MDPGVCLDIDGSGNDDRTVLYHLDRGSFTLHELSYPRALHVLTVVVLDSAGPPSDVYVPVGGCSRQASFQRLY